MLGLVLLPATVASWLLCHSLAAVVVLESSLAGWCRCLVATGAGDCIFCTRPCHSGAAVVTTGFCCHGQKLLPELLLLLQGQLLSALVPLLPGLRFVSSTRASVTTGVMLCYF